MKLKFGFDLRNATAVYLRGVQQALKRKRMRLVSTI